MNAIVDNENKNGWKRISQTLDSKAIEPSFKNLWKLFKAIIKREDSVYLREVDVQYNVSMYIKRLENDTISVNGVEYKL